MPRATDNQGSDRTITSHLRAWLLPKHKTIGEEMEKLGDLNPLVDVQKDAATMESSTGFP